ncbi:putative dCMP deaminase [Sclerotinia borealis F-4128]|uniref:Deoxycytidylate deaminase n=1 Tax=Sclerotinia borealis (strain F-4128) TaxID=1432307 RepID=W9CRF1_SCLBF|nr:putative dCMP deaminase [Sclerotinia borealis F-4128]
MLIGLCGGICAGKSTIAQYLVEHHGFTHLYLRPDQKSKKSTRITNGSTDAKQITNGESEIEEDGITRRQKSIPQSQSQYTFTSTADLLDFVTKRWRERWVITNIYNEAILDALLRRPFFILVSVDAPVSIRWKRFQARPNPPSTPLTLEDFLLRSDHHLYDPEHGLQSLISRATIRLLNTSCDLAHLYATLGKLDLTNEQRLRPSWDQYFMQLASLAAQRSNCMKRRVGCVLVREHRVISTGYNGTPRGLLNCGEGGCARCNEGQSSGVGLGTCLCLHAEENALLEAGRERVRENAILYCDTCPCLTCSIKIVQVGISEVVYSQGYSMDAETAAVFGQAGIKLRQFIPPANGLIHLEKQTLY